MKRKAKKISYAINHIDNVKILHLRGKKVTIRHDTRITKKLSKLLPHIRDIHVSTP